MILARNIRCITNVVQNVLTKNASGRPRNVKSGRTESFKTKLQIKWVRPEKIPSIMPEKSGDGGMDLGIKPQDYCNFFDKSKELEDADEIVKRMFTLEFAPRKESENKRREKTLATVQRHAADRGSMESRLAAMTSEILNLQEFLKQHPHNKQTAHFLKELIDKRKKFLGKLRRWDYKRFEWILEKLNLVYKPHPPVYERVERKKSLRILTRMHCDSLKKAKLRALRLELIEQKRSFILEKVEKLQFIRNEEIACGKEPTVSDDDIAAAKAACLQKSRGVPADEAEGDEEELLLYT